MLKECRALLSHKTIVQGLPSLVPSQVTSTLIHNRKKVVSPNSGKVVYQCQLSALVLEQRKSRFCKWYLGFAGFWVDRWNKFNTYVLNVFYYTLYYIPHIAARSAKKILLYIILYCVLYTIYQLLYYTKASLCIMARAARGNFLAPIIDFSWIS